MQVHHDGQHGPHAERRRISRRPAPGGDAPDARRKIRQDRHLHVRPYRRRRDGTGGQQGDGKHRFSRTCSTSSACPPHPAEEDIRVHFGGPVESGRGFVLHSADYVQDATMVIDEAIAMTATTDILRDIAEGDGPRNSLLALGYAGWGPGQLDTEIQANGWLSVPADDELAGLQLGPSEPSGRARWQKWVSMYQCCRATRDTRKPAANSTQRLTKPATLSRCHNPAIRRPDRAPSVSAPRSAVVRQPDGHLLPSPHRCDARSRRPG